MAESASASSSLITSAMRESDSSHPMTLQDYDVIPPWNTTDRKPEDKQLHQQLQEDLGPPHDSRADESMRAHGSSKSSEDSDITIISTDTPHDSVVGAEAASVSAASASASGSSQFLSIDAQNRSESSTERGAFHSMRVSSAAAAFPPNVSVMSRSAIIPSATQSPLAKEASSPNASSALVQSNEPASRIVDKSSAGTIEANFFV